MISTIEVESIIAVHFKITPAARRYDSPSNREKIAIRVRSYGVLPSDTGVMRAIAELVSEGAIARVDGGSEVTDRVAAAAAEQARINRIADAPLTDADFERFASMAPSDIERLFYSDQIFAARYRKAASKWGFVLPGRPAPVAQDVPVEADTSEWKALDAKTYNTMSAMNVTRLYRADQGFRRAVDRLIRDGRI